MQVRGVTTAAIVLCLAVAASLLARSILPENSRASWGRGKALLVPNAQDCSSTTAACEALLTQEVTTGDYSIHWNPFYVSMLFQGNSHMYSSVSTLELDLPMLECDNATSLLYRNFTLPNRLCNESARAALGSMQALAVISIALTVCAAVLAALSGLGVIRALQKRYNLPFAVLRLEPAIILLASLLALACACTTLILYSGFPMFTSPVLLPVHSTGLVTSPIIAAVVSQVGLEIGYHLWLAAIALLGLALLLSLAILLHENCIVGWDDVLLLPAPRKSSASLPSQV